ncbi:hypothetical protein LCGC14_0841270 [marine sediment metagenome]|uniref:Four helix bundle protein n=1 Tax=marine sediment metagenome TaxID=412755 RepID=A0A0F9PHQ4_9ZZZZ
MAFNFEKLDVYQKSVEFAENIYLITKDFPKEEQFGITSQLRRAAISISANIAEGSNRSYKHYRSFLDIARGSILECIPLLQIAKNESYISKDVQKELYEQCEVLSKMTSALKRSLKDK